VQTLSAAAALRVLGFAHRVAGRGGPRIPRERAPSLRCGARPFPRLAPALRGRLFSGP
jgi:hypothetical protein